MKLFFLTVCVLLQIQILKAQPSKPFTLPDFNPPDKLESSWDKLILSAIKPSICIVTHEYLLKNDSNEYYGFQDYSFYGKIYRLGVIQNQKVWIDSMLLSPWLIDDNYLKFKSELNDTIPVNTDSIYFYNNTTNFMAQLKLDKDSIKTVGGMILVSGALNNPNLNNFQYTFEGNDTVKNGFLVLGYIKFQTNELDASPDELSNIQFLTIRLKDLSRNQNILNIPENNIPKNLKIIGGLFVEAKVSPGQITLVNRGMVVQDVKTMKWQISLFKKSSAPPITQVAVNTPTITNTKNAKKPTKNPETINPSSKPIAPDSSNPKSNKIFGSKKLNPGDIPQDSDSTKVKSQINNSKQNLPLDSINGKKSDKAKKIEVDKLIQQNFINGYCINTMVENNKQYNQVFTKPYDIDFSCYFIQKQVQKLN